MCKCDCCCKCDCRDFNNEYQIEAKDFNDGWMKDNKIEIRPMCNKPMSRLLAVRLCNKILKYAKIDFVMSELHMQDKYKD